MGVLALVGFCLYSALRLHLSAAGGSAMSLSSLGVSKDGFKLEAVFVPTDQAVEFRVGRSRASFSRVRVSGSFWPPLSDCLAVMDGFSMRATTLRPGAALESLFELDRQVGASCSTLKLSPGEIWLEDSPPLRLDFEEASLDRMNQKTDILVSRLDGQPTSLVLHGTRTGDGPSKSVRTRGEWNLSGLDVTGLLARVGLSWSSRTDVGYLEFESAGDDLGESGRLGIYSWVLLGKNEPKPFRLSVPKVTADFGASDSEIVFHDIQIGNPNYDLMGANPEIFQNILARPFFMPKHKTRKTKLPVSERHRQRAAALPSTFSVKVENLRIDTGSALALDRPERTLFALKITDLSLILRGPASILAKTPNTTIQFRLNDQKHIRWSAITDFSTWPPQFRLTKVD